MATNKIQTGDILTVTMASGTTVNRFYSLGTGGLNGMALETVTAGDTCQIDVSGAVWDYSVSAANSTAASAVAVGDKLYISAAGAAFLSKDGRSGRIFIGYALETLTAGDVDTINVKHHMI